MKIIHVIDQLSMTHGGGAAMVAYKLAEAHAHAGHEVSVFTTDWRMDGQEAPEGVTVRAFPLTCSPLGMRFAAGLLPRVLPRGAVVHIHNYRGIIQLIGALYRRPFVLQAHGSLPRNWHMRFPDTLIEETWQRGIFNRAAVYVAESGIEVGQYLDLGAQRRQVRTIPPGITWEEYQDLPRRRLSPCRRILYLGRLNEIKGVDRLITAFKSVRHPSWLLQIAGPDDGDEAHLRDMAGSDGHIVFLGPLYGRDKLQAYVDADLYVLPSRRENFGITTLEALACGTPVLITAGQGLAETLPPYCGMVTADLAEGLVEALERDWRGNQDARRMYALSFDWDKIAQQHIKVYEEVLR